MIGNSVARVSASGVENKRRPLALNTFGRLGIITVVTLGLMTFSHQLGFGILAGLAVFQVILLANVARSMAKAGPMTSVDDVINANVVDDNIGHPPDRRPSGRPTMPGAVPERHAGPRIVTSSPPRCRHRHHAGRPSPRQDLRPDLRRRHHLGHRHRRRHRHHHGADPAGQKATNGVPGKFQLLWELAVGAVQKQVDDTIGPRGAKVVPLALTLFVFIFTCNLFEALSIGSTYDWLPAPTSDVNLPLAMALFVIVLVHRAAIKNRGVRGYVKHYFTRPFPKKWLFPFNLFMNGVEELVKPVTLTLRLFGNLFAGGLMLSLLASLVIWKLGPAPIGAVSVGAVHRGLEAVRHGHRRHPGLHLRPAHHLVLRHRHGTGRGPRQVG
jgi:ATP synthase subunit 6